MFSFLFVFAYILSYNIIVVKEEGILMLKKYFSKYKWTDLFWILFVILVGIYSGNNTLYPYTLIPTRNYLLLVHAQDCQLLLIIFYLLINLLSLAESKTRLGKNSIPGENKVNSSRL